MKRRWFMRRRVGFGVRPASWQGFVITAVALALIGATFVVVHASAVRLVVIVAVALAYQGVGYATGGTRRAAVRGASESHADHDAADAGDPLESLNSSLEPSTRPAPLVSTAELRSALDASAAAASDAAPETRPIAIEVKNLTKVFGERTAFSDVTFSVRQGEVFGFLGPNGAGKTTTVRTLSTLIAATSGSAVVAGIPVCEENGVEIRQRISVMPEVPGLYSRLSVTDNLEFFVGLYGLTNPGPRIARALEAVNLSNRAGDPCGSLSKGLRQRVSIARALLSDPEIIFLDEPTSGLDPVATREVTDLIGTLRSRGVTIFLTTHRLEEAERTCDRVAILNTTLRVVGRTSELRDQLFKRSLHVSTLAALKDPAAVFTSIPGVDSWKVGADGVYELTAHDPRSVAPVVVRALVGAGADVVSIAESQHSLEDVYLQLVSDDVEADS